MGLIVDLSISSSDAFHRSAKYPWGRIFLKGIFLCLFLIAGWESFWRSQGYKPKIVDSYELWANKHSALYEKGEKGFAMIGASRLMQAVDPDVLRDEIPGIYPVQLGKSGASPLQILKYMAEETDFHGTVIVDVTPRILFGNNAFSERTISEWLNRYREERKRDSLLLEPYYGKMEPPLGRFFESKLLIAGDRVNPLAIARQFIKGDFPKPYFWEITGDRQQLMDYSGVDIEAFSKSRIKLTATAKGLSEKHLVTRLSQLESCVAKLIGRGARVIFMKTPTTLGVRKAEEKHFPASRYWRSLVTRVQGEKVNCNEIKNLSEFTCSDGAHIDSEQSSEFTRRLLPYIR
jgi:hypothetical protein